MANRPKSPVGTPKSDKDASFWDKIGTLGRKKNIKRSELWLLVEKRGFKANNCVPKDCLCEVYHIWNKSEYAQDFARFRDKF